MRRSHSPRYENRHRRLNRYSGQLTRQPLPRLTKPDKRFLVSGDAGANNRIEQGQLIRKAQAQLAKYGSAAIPAKTRGDAKRNRAR
jgi:hypothetical protein